MLSSRKRIFRHSRRPNLAAKDDHRNFGKLIGILHGTQA
ncbi:hypothetical protein TH47_15885 [Thalassospira sp. MCCC 1A02803]|nr:hypothetical protein TH47_15885 [Thalassospira sp. MCCC 1A02803]